MSRFLPRVRAWGSSSMLFLHKPHGGSVSSSSSWRFTCSLCSLFFFFFFFFFILYILYLHLKWFLLSWLPPLRKFHKPSSLLLFPNQPLSASLSWYSPTLLHWASPGPGASPSFFLNIIWYVDCFLGIPSFWTNICLSWVHTMCVLLWLGHLSQDDILQFLPLA